MSIHEYVSFPQSKKNWYPQKNKYTITVNICKSFNICPHFSEETVEGLPDVDMADDEDLNKELSLFEIKRGRSQSLSAVPQDGDTRSAFFPASQTGEDRQKFAEVKSSKKSFSLSQTEIYLGK